MLSMTIVVYNSLYHFFCLDFIFKNETAKSMEIVDVRSYVASYRSNHKITQADRATFQ